MLGVSKGNIDSVLNFGDRFQDRRVPLWILGIVISADLGLLIRGEGKGLLWLLKQGSASPLDWFYMSLGVLIFWLFNSFFAIVLRIVFIFLILDCTGLSKLFNLNRIKADENNFTHQELRHYAIKYENKILDDLYQKLLQEQVKQIHFSNFMFSGLMFFTLDVLISGNSLIRSCPVWLQCIIYLFVLLLVIIVCIPDKDEKADSNQSKYFIWDIAKDKFVSFFPDEKN